MLSNLNIKKCDYLSLLFKPGGKYGSRTHLEGFADPCLTDRLTRHKL
jgi:hypothetical protein